MGLQRNYRLNVRSSRGGPPHGHGIPMLPGHQAAAAGRQAAARQGRTTWNLMTQNPAKPCRPSTSGASGHHAGRKWHLKRRRTVYSSQLFRTLLVLQDGCHAGPTSWRCHAVMKAASGSARDMSFKPPIPNLRPPAGVPPCGRSIPVVQGQQGGAAGGHATGNALHTSTLT